MGAQSDVTKLGGFCNPRGGSRIQCMVAASLRRPVPRAHTEITLMPMLRNTHACRQVLASASSIAALATSASAIDPVPYSGCGILEAGTECPLFVGDDGTTFSMPDLGGFKLGSYIAVSGTICFDCPNICQEGPVFHAEIIKPCFGIPPKLFFSRCGTLIEDTTGQVPCTLFQTDFDDQLYVVDNIPPEFSVGDHVRVTTNEIVLCLRPCDSTSICLFNNTMQECGSPVDMCGTIVDFGGGPVFNCTNFVADDGQTYMIANLGPFVPGNRARITGFVEDCSWCQFVNGCLLEHLIEPCADVTGDGVIDVDDLIAVIAGWGPCPEGCAADVDGSDAVDVDDLIFVILNWPAKPG
jgi:hypothetical protein